MQRDSDAAIRTAVFEWLDQQKSLHGDVLPYGALARGFDFEGHRVPILGPQGIFKPAILPDMPLSIMTAAPKLGYEAPYADEVTGDGLLLYRYRGSDPQHRDNVCLRRAYERGAPLVYLYGISPGEYEAVYPVTVVGDNPRDLTFLVDLAPAGTAAAVSEAISPYADIRKAYAVRSTLQRLHQRRFRRSVITAYTRRCAICRLRHDELLDAAHILPDADPRSLPIVPNGVSLCTLHHSAFDHHLIGIRPDLKVELRRDVLEEEDGPMLIHGLQGFQGATILVPRLRELRPNSEFLEERYELFRQAG